MGAADHPLDEVLVAYERGELTENRAGPLETHLRECDRCRETLQRIRGTDDDAGRVRGALIESTRSATVAGAPGWGDDPVDGGRPSAGALSESWLSLTSGKADVEGGDDERAHPERGDSDGGSSSDWPVPDYERIALCGEGAYGTVWAVRDRVGVYRAVKMIDMRMMGRQQLACRESAALETYCRRVGRHPALIGVYHVGVVGRWLYYTMDLADDDKTKAPVTGDFPRDYRPLTLKTVIRRRRIHPDTAIEITRRLLRGLARLHELGLVHRDIKPGNIVFVRKAPKLADIGMITPGTGRIESIGTPRYMPPDRIMDRTGDTFAIGKVLHEMISGRDCDAFPLLLPEYMHESTKWDMAKVEELITRACAPAAEQRYQSASDILEDLEACAQRPFGSILDEIDAADAQLRRPLHKSPGDKQITVALIRTIPWIAGFITLLVLLSWFKGSGGASR